MISETGLLRTEVEKILLIFFESTHNLLEEINDSLNNKDYLAIKKIAHKIKGTSTNLRLEWISKIIGELETACEKKDLEACKKLTEELSIYINQYYACI